MAIAKLRESIIIRNESIIKDHLYSQMNDSLDCGAQVLDHELKKGVSILLKPIIKTVYNSLVRTEFKHSTEKLVNGLIKITKEMLRDGVDVGSDEFYERLERKFPAYLRVDQTFQQLKSSHKNTDKVKTHLKTTFEWQVRPIHRLLQVGDMKIDDYPTLCTNAFNRDELKTTLANQTNSMAKSLEIIDQDKSILKLPAAKDLFMRVLKKGFDKKIQDFQNEIDTFYN